MRIEIVSRTENKLLGRIEVKYIATHIKEKAPSREDVKAQLSANLQVPKELIIIDHSNTEFGRSVTEGYAKVYKTKEAAMKLEPDYLLLRNGLIEKKE
ncbi:MAG: 30S ribosomal protein S24e [Candidatus Thermoplasmatota archaeon]|jgi:small subunit ribosomal protein S24e|nr:30S ribosomal protein S24e [Candidatus Thermoplasmatota archaeon]